MLTNNEKNYYSRHILLEEISTIGQEKLKNSSVLVIGAGGLGCPTLLYLAAAGVGRIGIIDPDVVDITNLHRQILFTTEDVGTPKVFAAQKALSKRNPFIDIEVYFEVLSADNALHLFEKYDIIVEGSDRFSTKYLSNDAAVLSNKPLVMASIFKFEGQLSVYNYQNGATYRCLFPETASMEDVPTCSDVGVLGTLPGILGVLMANEVLKIALGIGEVLSGKLLKIDLKTLQQDIFIFKKDPSINIQHLQNYEDYCITSTVSNISFNQYLAEKEKYNLLDVRAYHEREAFHIGGYHIPLAEIPKRWEEIPTDKPILVYCTAGIRSKKAVELLKPLLRCSVYNLKNGIG